MPEATDSLSEALRAQALSFSAAFASSQADVPGVEATGVRPPLGSGLFPEPLLAAAARLATSSVFPTLETQAALGITRPNAVSFTVHEDGFAATFRSKDLTVGQALADQGVRIDDGDFVSPPPNKELTAGAHIYISHSISVKLVVAGIERDMKTHAGTVEDVLAQAGVSLESKDRVSPRPRNPLRNGMVIKVTTVREITEVTEEAIAYGSIIEYDSELARGQRVISQGGINGSVRREYRVRQINGRETGRELVSETTNAPTDEVVTVGTYVKPVATPVAAGVVASPEGLNCSRTLNVYATWYTAASAGGSGVTATGTGVYKGIVAVDPRVIPLGTRMYIPGYGYGIAADTGGAVIGNHIDLGYGADDVKDWRTRWVDICIL